MYDCEIGDAALKQQDFYKLTLVSSDRQFAYMVLKAAGVSLPIIVSLASSVMAAKKAEVTLISVPNKECAKVHTFQHGGHLILS